MKKHIILAVCAVVACGSVFAGGKGKMVERQVSCGSAFEACMGKAYVGYKGPKRDMHIVKCANTSYMCRCHKGLMSAGCKIVK